jgi:protein required for attachment to host cells
MDPPTDAHRHSKRTFAADVVKSLEEQLGKKAFDRLVLIAAPATLGDLRAAMSKALQQVVHAELPKDLVNVPNQELAPHLSDILAV